LFGGVSRAAGRVGARADAGREEVRRSSGVGVDDAENGRFGQEEETRTQAALIRRLGAAFVGAATLVATLSVCAQPSMAQAVNVYETKVRPAIAFVRARKGSKDQTGTAFVIASDATSSKLLTASHVVFHTGAATVAVYFNDDTRTAIPAKVLDVGNDVDDVALLEIPKGNLQPADFFDCHGQGGRHHARCLGRRQGRLHPRCQHSAFGPRDQAAAGQVGRTERGRRAAAAADGGAAADAAGPARGGCHPVPLANTDPDCGTDADAPAHPDPASDAYRAGHASTASDADTRELAVGREHGGR
jgi:hypothetical protein